MDYRRADNQCEEHHFMHNWLQTGNGHHEPLLGAIFPEDNNELGKGSWS